MESKMVPVLKKKQDAEWCINAFHLLMLGTYVQM